MRSIMDYTMGFVFFCLGIFFIVYRQFDIRIMGREPSNLDYLIGGLFTIYGRFAFVRGLLRHSDPPSEPRTGRPIR